jgi:hypothetical protein
MANIKITQLPTATTIGDNDLIPVVTGIGGTPATEHITKFDFAATIASSPIDTNPVENTYSDIATMLADQINQTTSYFNYVIDASADPNVLAGEAYYEKKSSSTTTLSTDYRLLSDTEVTVITDSNSYRVFRIQAIQDEASPLTSVKGGQISFEYSGANVTAVLFNARYTDAILEFYGKDVNVRFYNRTTKKYETEAVASTAWTTVNTSFYRAEVTGTNIQIADLSVNNRVEFFIVEASAGGGGSSPLTTKGDVYGFSTVDARLPIGTDAQVLTADSAEALGVKWATPSSAASLESDINQVAHGFSVGDAIRNNGTIFIKALADSVANAGVIGIVSVVTDVDNFTYQFGGILTVGTWTLGVDYFLSPATSGLIITEPTYSVGEVRQYIGSGVPAGLLIHIDLGNEIENELLLPSGTEASDHLTASDDMVINVCYGTSATPPTASTTTEGTLYIQYTA